jgi:small subunit ribosomal protein S21
LSIKVEVRNGNLEQAMRVLKKKLLKDGLVKTLKMKQYYEKPSEIRRRKKKEGIANFRKKQKKLLATRGY